MPYAAPESHRPPSLKPVDVQFVEVGALDVPSLTLRFPPSPSPFPPPSPPHARPPGHAGKKMRHVQKEDGSVPPCTYARELSPISCVTPSVTKPPRVPPFGDVASATLSAESFTLVFDLKFGRRNISSRKCLTSHSDTFASITSGNTERGQLGLACT